MIRLIRSAVFPPLVVLAVALAPCQLGAQDEKTPEEKQGFKRRDNSSDEDLRKQLQLVPEVGFDQAAAALLVNSVSKLADVKGANAPADAGLRFLTQRAAQFKRSDWLALPWRTGLDNQLGKEAAENLNVYSVHLRLAMRQSVPPNDVRPEVEKLQNMLTALGRMARDKPLDWRKSECVPTLSQMLQMENTPLRLWLIELLAKIEGKGAGVVLAQRSLFDLSPEVREKAVAALASRPAKDYQQTLLDGLRSPWQPAADHAAEAIAALKLKDVVPEMVAMLKEPNPNLPYTKEVKGDKATYVREMVRMNHLSNCLLCHAPSMSKEDLVRGRMPIPGQEMPPLYYAEPSGPFVRADITFLKQDFSVAQPVANPGKWAGQQRFDYMLRERKATTKEISLLQGLRKENKLDAAYPQREAVLFGLREVTGVDHGSRADGWHELLKGIADKKASPKQ